ncbi:MAG TPA: Fur family transcriptional regulator [Micromonosporaceae bacterium]|nr:Fur family transcriptional regulator [Micromonosporaceae bacterium]
MSGSSLAEALRARGLRLTAQRQLVLDAVRSRGHATPEQIHATVRRTAAGVNITTVYRTLELLEDLGLVTHTHLSHGAPTYHAAGDKSHVHLVCHQCGTVDEAPRELLEPLARKLEEERSFLMDIGHVALFGLCSQCGDCEPDIREPDISEPDRGAGRGA